MVPERTDDASIAKAYRLLWLAVIFDFLAFGIGFEWDKRWHATHAFEDFFSPPHLFIYTMHLCATITLAYIAFTPGLRRWFGETFRLPLISFPIPGAVGLAGAGFGVVAFAGMFDAIWHLSFGLDETNWSFPHSMLGWGLFIAFLGITSCRVALWKWRPIGWPSAIVFGFLIAATSADRFAGPLANKLSPEVPLRLAHPGAGRRARLPAHNAHLSRRGHPPLQPAIRTADLSVGRVDAGASASLQSTALAHGRSCGAAELDEHAHPVRGPGGHHRNRW
jgi:hypothetical protein